MSDLLDETVGVIRVRCAAAAIRTGTGPTMLPGDLRVDAPAGRGWDATLRIPAEDRARLASLIAAPSPAGSDLAFFRARAEEALVAGAALTTIEPATYLAILRELEDGRARAARLDLIRADRLAREAEEPCTCSPSVDVDLDCRSCHPGIRRS